MVSTTTSSSQPAALSCLRALTAAVPDPTITCFFFATTSLRIFYSSASQVTSACRCPAAAAAVVSITLAI